MKRTDLPIAHQAQLVAEAITGSWRDCPPTLDIDAQTLAQITPLLIDAGVGSLTWRRIRETDLQTTESARDLQQLHRHYALQNLLHEQSLKQVFLLMRAQGIEPVLVKGWALKSIYPEPGIRPFGDIDLCVRPADYSAAADALAIYDGRPLNVDLHRGFGKFYDHRTEELFGRSRLIKLDDLEVRVLSFEDHLRFLCLHLLRHGANRPLWLCDIAAALEALPEGFDWDLCLGNHQPQSDWIACAIGLAHQLLGVKIDQSPITERARNLPRWLLPAVLNEWGRRFDFPMQVASYIHRPKELLRELPRHWPNPIEATVDLRCQFNNLPRLPFQIGDTVAKTVRFFVQMRKKR